MLQRKHYFAAVFFGFFAFAFKTLIFLCWPFFLLVLNFCVFFLFLLLLFQKSSCYVVVSVFCCIGFPWFFSVVCVVFFGLCLASLVFFWRVKGSVEVAQSPPPKKNMAAFFLFLLLFLVVFLLLWLWLFYLWSFFVGCSCCCCCSCCYCCFCCSHVLLLLLLLLLSFLLLLFWLLFLLLSLMLLLFLLLLFPQNTQ